MLRIHFTDADLARIQVATAPDPLWETVLGVHQLSAPKATHAFTSWRRRARTEVAGRRLGGVVRLLNSLAPADVPYFPDFLTPEEASKGLASGLDAVRATPLARLRHELGMLDATTSSARRRAGRPGPSGDEERKLYLVADALHRVYETIIEPDWTRMAAHVEADRSLRLRALRDGGTKGLLESLRPVATWRAPVLYMSYPVDRDIHLDGRGLRLVPSRFCWRRPVSLCDDRLPPVLVYPVASEEPHPASSARPTGADDGPHAAALTALLGTTRARVLEALAAAATTGELAVRLGISPASASKHTRALREARLVVSRRDGGMVVHTLTPLGAALLDGELPSRPARNPLRAAYELAER